MVYVVVSRTWEIKLFLNFLVVMVFVLYLLLVIIGIASAIRVLAFVFPKSSNPNFEHSAKKEPDTRQNSEMTFYYPCHGCEKRLRVKQKHIGRSAKCPRCDNLQTVPLPGPAAAEMERLERRKKEKQLRAEKKLKEKQDRLAESRLTLARKKAEADRLEKINAEKEFRSKLKAEKFARRAKLNEAKARRAATELARQKADELARIKAERIRQKYVSVYPRVEWSLRRINAELKTGYLRSSVFHRIKQLANETRELFDDPPEEGILEETQIIDFLKILQIANWDKSDRDSIQLDYLERAKSDYKQFFDKFESNPLTSEQRDACVIDEDNNLVLAGAGTGKTSTIVAKAGFLLESKQAHANEILMLAYGKQAAKEMSERLTNRVEGESPSVSTFHKLGMQIIATVEGAKPSITPLVNDPDLFRHQVNQWFESSMAHSSYREIVLRHFERYLYEEVNSFDFETEGEYFDYIRANEIRTFKGEEVKSYEECLIANHLFRLGIEYEYERPYEVETGTLDYRQYKPDFYLPDFEIYIEHFGIDHDGCTAPFIDREAYEDGMEWKRDTHSLNETTLLETFSYERMDGNLLQNLERKLREYGCDFEPRSEKELLESLRKFGVVWAFADLLGQLLQHYRRGRFSRDSFDTLIGRASAPEVMRSTLEILLPIVDKYEKHLAESHEIDFDDMIGKATDYVASGKFRSPWKHILVDEFQDISEQRARLITTLRDSIGDCRLFCVGDDWQSIYRFTGSDNSFTFQFSDRFGDTHVTKLQKTFRSNDRICDVASKFVLKNPRQIKKSLIAANRVNSPAVTLLRSWPDEELEDRLRKVLSAIDNRHTGKNKSVFLLGRYRFALPDTELMRTMATQFSKLQIESHTIHGAKGKEADFVVVLGLSKGRNGFPSQKATHPLLNAMLPDEEPFEFAEERRLFYVAMTRARHRVYLIADMSNPSQFVNELLEKAYDVEQSEFPTGRKIVRCRKCVTGTLVERKGEFGVFFGCSNFPLCDHTENGCKSCENAMQPFGRFIVCTNSKCGNWIPICPECGGRMIEREGQSRFWGCSNYSGRDAFDTCRHTENEIFDPKPTKKGLMDQAHAEPNQTIGMENPVYSDSMDELTFTLPTTCPRCHKLFRLSDYFPDKEAYFEMQDDYRKRGRGRCLDCWNPSQG